MAASIWPPRTCQSASLAASRRPYGTGSSLYRRPLRRCRLARPIELVLRRLRLGYFFENLNPLLPLTPLACTGRVQAHSQPIRGAMLSPPTELIDAARRGEPGAVLGLIRVCQPNLARFARRTCSTTEDAEDAVQMALWQLHRRVGALRTVAAFAGWLFRIVERECYRLFRRRRDTVPVHELLEHEAPRAAAVPQDLRLDLARAIEQLEPPYREVLLLRDLHELTAPEVAQQLGLSIEAVKSRLQRGRARVREQLLASGYWLKDGLPQAKAASNSVAVTPHQN